MNAAEAPYMLNGGLWKRYADAMRPLPDLSPSEFSAKYRILHPIYCSERPGHWDNTLHPYQPIVLDMIEECVKTGRRGLAAMKAGQIGGTDLFLNGMLWFKTYFPGPQIFMTSTDEQAGEFGRGRFAYVIPDMEPLRDRFIPNARGDIYTKRFTDGKIQLCGGNSINNLQSEPYRLGVLDEYDSLVENLDGAGDPLKNLQIRLKSFTGQTLLLVYAHPTTSKRGIGKLFYRHTDQRRPHIQHDCRGGDPFPVLWEHVKVIGDKQDPDAYRYICPHCGTEIGEAERVAMLRKLSYQSMLPPEEARRKRWIGAQFGQLIAPTKTLREIAQDFIECNDEENALRVFRNKILGETDDAKVQKIDDDALRKLIVFVRKPDDPDVYVKGELPPGVQFITAGQDSRHKEFHLSVWGWGYRRGVDKLLSLCGWLLDWEAFDRATPGPTFDENEYRVFDDLIYNRIYRRRGSEKRLGVRQCGHDFGYAPTQLAIFNYCRRWPDRAIPVRGASDKPTSASIAAPWKWGQPQSFKVNSEIDKEDIVAPFFVNTYLLKTEWFGATDPSKQIEIYDRDAHGEIIGKRKVSRLTLPANVSERFMDESKNEELVKGRREGELIWKKQGQGQNHFCDCNVYALSLAHSLRHFMVAETEDEADARERHPRIPRQVAVKRWNNSAEIG